MRYDLLDDRADEALTAVLTLGASKYTPNGWRQVEEAFDRYYAALRRHLQGLRKFLRTRDIKDALDEETGFPHAAQALCNMHFLTALFIEEHMPEFDGDEAAKRAIAKWRAMLGPTVASARSRAKKKV